MTRLKEWSNKISESVKKNWVIRRCKYGNNDGCRNPDEKNRKVSEAHKGKPVVPLGTIPWNKGVKGTHFSPESEFKKGLVPWNKGTKGVVIAWNKGLSGYTSKPASEERKRKISKQLTGNKNNLGNHHSIETRMKMRQVSAVRLSKQPHKDTKPELALVKTLDSLEIKYEQQVPIDTCIPDFFIQPNICIFVDGLYWHNRPEIKERDLRVNQSLINLGYKVMRFWDSEVYNNSQYCELILKEISRSDAPPHVSSTI